MLMPYSLLLKKLTLKPEINSKPLNFALVLHKFSVLPYPNIERMMYKPR